MRSRYGSGGKHGVHRVVETFNHVRGANFVSDSKKLTDETGFTYSRNEIRIYVKGRTPTPSIFIVNRDGRWNIRNDIATFDNLATGIAKDARVVADLVRADESTIAPNTDWRSFEGKKQLLDGRYVFVVSEIIANQALEQQEMTLGVFHLEWTKGSPQSQDN